MPGDPITGPVPVLAVVGRPNVGKSTLVNRILGRREAVVEDVPGVTRDRVSYDAVWNGRAFTVVDTGGWDPDARGLAERIAAQAEVAVQAADAVLFVVDAEGRHHRRRRGRGADPADARGSPSCWPRTRSTTSGRARGRRAVEPRAGRAVAGLGAARARLGRPARRDARRAARPAGARTSRSRGARGAWRSSGKPNVGKSSLLNKLAGEDRVVVDDVAGTTVDPVDELVSWAAARGASSTPRASASG